MSELLQPGDVIKLDETHTVYADIPQHFVFVNHKGDFSLCHQNVTMCGEFDYLQGDYVVQSVAEDGGGWAHRDSIPDGHHVFCERTDGKYKVDFYQTGFFNAMIEEIEPIGRAEMKFVAVP